MASSLIINNVEFKYPGNEQVILEVEEFEVKNGELVFLLGRSGVGKTTLVEFIGLMNEVLVIPKLDESIFELSLDSMNIDYLKLNSNEKREDARSKAFSFVFQENNLMSSLTVYENIIAPFLAAQRHPPDYTYIMGLLEKVHLPANRIHDSVLNFSGGQKQRISFLRALIKPFQVFLGDEPTASLDPLNATRLMQLTKKQLQNMNNAFGLIITHQTSLAFDNADKIVVCSFADNRGMIKSELTFARKKVHTWLNKDGVEYSSKDLLKLIHNHL
jgi:ABC-type lipoprotein export system ATPase subunit